MSYLDSSFYQRDPKQFMRGYNAGIAGKSIDACEYTPGGEWHQSWIMGFVCANNYLAYQEELLQQQIRDRQDAQNKRNQEMEDARQRRTEKQQRNKENRQKRGQEQSEFQRKRK